MLTKDKKNIHRKKTHTVHLPEGHIRVETKVQPSGYFRLKEVIERAVAAILLVLGLPMIGLLIVLVRICSRGPGIYRQVRLGKGARVFTMYKIRTMRLDAEKNTGPIWAGTRDPRITPLGRFLRKVHLDELPQLINVVKNEMSLIGPRPERPEIASAFFEQIPGYSDRMAVLPGVTGLAQINLPPDSTVDDVRRKLVLDKKYIREAGPWLDVRILLSTFVRMMGVPGGVAMRLFRLRCHEVHDDGEVAATADGEGNGHSHRNPTGGNGRSDDQTSRDSAKPNTDHHRKPR
jgi:lipopolysaccharide/colanic/teichoic acid biosynthesis glycosyltransferase